MARDVADDNYYVTTGGKIPLKWTSPEVCNSISHTVHCYCKITDYLIGNILQEIFSAK